MKVQLAFQERWPQISLVSATGLNIPGRAMDTTPLMQIAGDISPSVLYVNFRQSGTYIRSRCLYPLDRCLKGACPGAETFGTDRFVADGTTGHELAKTGGRGGGHAQVGRRAGRC